LNKATGLVLVIIGLAMLILCGITEGGLRVFPSQLGVGFLLAGCVILVFSRSRRRRKNGR